MKKLLFLTLILSFFLSNLALNAQIVYQYDSDGNRTGKYAPPTAYHVSGTNTTCSDSATITVAGSEYVNVYKLYLNTSTLVSTITGTGSGLTFPSVKVTGSYKVVANNQINVTTDMLDVINVTIRPSMPTAGNNSRCGTGTVTITATPGAGETVDWYAASSGGSALLSGNTSYTTPTLSSTTTYYAESRNTTTHCISQSRRAVVATINSVPSAPSAGNNSRCNAGIITITCNPGTGNTADWYSASTGGTLLSYGSTSYTVTLNSTATFYAQSRNSSTGCTSTSRTAVVATINSCPIPHAPTAGNAGCSVGYITITATPDNSTGTETVDWYSAPTGGSSLIVNNTSYYAYFGSTTTCYAESRNVSTSAVSVTRTPVTAYTDWDAPTLTSPANNAHQITLNPAYNWNYNDHNCADSFALQISPDMAFNNYWDWKTVYQNTSLPTPGTRSLINCQSIYWRVLAKKGGETKSSSVFAYFSNPCKEGVMNSLLNSIQIVNNPNPFSEWTTIEYFVNENENVSIDLYSMIGEKIPIIESSYRTAGSYSIEFNSENLSNGVYTLILQTGTQTATTNMIIIK